MELVSYRRREGLPGSNRPSSPPPGPTYSSPAAASSSPEPTAGSSSSPVSSTSWMPPSSSTKKIIFQGDQRSGCRRARGAPRSLAKEEQSSSTLCFPLVSHAQYRGNKHVTFSLYQ